MRNPTDPRRLAFALVILTFSVAAARPAPAQSKAPTPGPAQKVGSAIDKAVREVGSDVAEALLATKIRIALLEHLKKDALGVHIEVRGDAVALTGKVSHRSSQELAEKVAASVEGVRSVKNGIAVEVEGAPEANTKVSQGIHKAEAEVKDALLEAHVKVRLIDQLGRVAFAIEVEATDGVVSLSGNVPDTARRELARDVARATSGVVEVHDLMHVK